MDTLSAVLNEEQWVQARTLADGLGRDQLLWLSGYLAGAAQGKGQAGAASGLQLAGTPPADVPQSGGEASRGITILYATETGNSRTVAGKLAEKLQADGQRVVLQDMAKYKVRQLAQEQDLLIVASTYGEGEPPQSALSFFEFLDSRKAPRLDGLRYAVLSLGDSTYQHFCAAGRHLDERLSALGAQALLARVDCDVDYDDAAREWTQALAGCLAQVTAQAAPAAGALRPASVAPAAPRYDRQHPCTARVAVNQVLTGRGSSKEVRHIELALDDASMLHEPGDALGLVPRNDPEVVDRLLSLTGLAPDAAITLKDQATTLGAALSGSLDIVNITPRFLEQWGALSGAGELGELAAADQAARRVAFAREHHVADVLRKYPVQGVDATTLVAALRPLQPRLYSIASSAAAAPGEIHLTVGTVRYALHDEPRWGVASGQLSRYAPEDTELAVYVQSAPHFRLPAGDAPIIMIGAGTGVAPYRAFLQEREVNGTGGRSWLFFGDRNFRSDFLYQTEWQTWLKDGLLDRMDVAFSRDGASKAYVWHRLLEQADDVYRWLQEGAHIYVCGDAQGLAPDVHRALAEIVINKGGLDADGAHDYLASLQESHRYQRDVY